MPFGRSGDAVTEHLAVGPQPLRDTPKDEGGGTDHCFRHGLRGQEVEGWFIRNCVLRSRPEHWLLDFFVGNAPELS